MLADYAVRVEDSRGRRHFERRTPIATIFNATATGSSMPAPFAAWKRRRKFSPGVTPTTFATG